MTGARETGGKNTKRNNAPAVPDRRRNSRFPMKLPVRYRAGRVQGWGRIVNISSGGALLTLDDPVGMGQRIELCIGWPVLLHERVHLNLIADGTVLRLEEGCAAVRFERSEFRTSTAEFRRMALLPEIRVAPAHR